MGRGLAEGHNTKKGADWRGFWLKVERGGEDTRVGKKRGGPKR